MNERYIIALTDNSSARKVYLYREPDYGLLMGTDDIGQANIFNTFPEANTVYIKLLAENPRVVGGVQYPPDFIARGLNMNYKNSHASGVLTIEEIKTVIVCSNPVRGEIIHGSAN